MTTTIQYHNKNYFVELNGENLSIKTLDLYPDGDLQGTWICNTINSCLSLNGQTLPPKLLKLIIFCLNEGVSDIIVNRPMLSATVMPHKREYEINVHSNDELFITVDGVYAGRGVWDNGVIRDCDANIPEDVYCKLESAIQEKISKL